MQPAKPLELRADLLCNGTFVERLPADSRDLLERCRKGRLLHAITGGRRISARQILCSRIRVTCQLGGVAPPVECDAWSHNVPISGEMDCRCQDAIQRH
jgi:hypothetical protein